MSKRGHKLIAKLLAPNRLATASRARRIARLHHKALDDAMEYVAVVIPIPAVHTKVLCRLGALLAKQFDVNIALGRVNNCIVEALLQFCFCFFCK